MKGSERKLCNFWGVFMCYRSYYRGLLCTIENTRKTINWPPSLSHWWGWIMVMASFTLTPNSVSSSLLRLHPSSPSQISPLLPSYQQQLGGGGGGGGSCRRSRGSLVVTRGGPPGTSTYIFAFVFPLSLLAVTIFTAIRISDKLDKDFYEEVKPPISFLRILVDFVIMGFDVRMMHTNCLMKVSWWGFVSNTSTLCILILWIP